MTRDDLERIARTVLRELGVSADALTVGEWEGQPGCWRVGLGASAGGALRIRCGAGSSPQWVREQIVEQVLAR